MNTMQQHISLLQTELEQRFQPLQESVGNTALFEILKSDANGNRLFAKAEFANPTGSHYDRIYAKLFEANLKMLVREQPDYLIEVSSGTAGASFAWFCAKLGLPCRVIVPRGVPESFLSHIRALNPEADVRYAESERPHLQGAIDDLKKSFVAARRLDHTVCYFDHARRLETIEATADIAREASEQLGRDFGLKGFDQFVVACGNGASVVGTGGTLKRQFPHLKVTAFEPQRVPVGFNAKFDAQKPVGSSTDLYHGGEEAFALPFIQEERFGFKSIVDDVVLLDDAALQESRKLRFRIGQSVGQTSLAGLAVAQKLMKRAKNQNFLVLFYDRGQRHPYPEEQVSLSQTRILV